MWLFFPAIFDAMMNKFEGERGGQYFVFNLLLLAAMILTIIAFEGIWQSIIAAVLILVGMVFFTVVVIND